MNERTTSHHPIPGFEDRLTNAIFAKGYSKVSFAKELGVNRHTVYGWCDGVSSPKAYYLWKASKVLGISLDWLVCGKEER